MLPPELTVVSTAEPPEETRMRSLLFRIRPELETPLVILYMAIIQKPFEFRMIDRKHKSIIYYAVEEKSSE